MTQPNTETSKSTYRIQRKPYRIGQISRVDLFDIFADGVVVGTVFGEKHAQVLAELFTQLQCDHPQENLIVSGNMFPPYKRADRPTAVCYKCGRILPDYPVDEDASDHGPAVRSDRWEDR